MSAKPTTFEAACRCGSSTRFQVAPASAGEKILALFWQVHNGEGHGPVSMADAEAMRHTERHRDGDLA